MTITIVESVFKREPTELATPINIYRADDVKKAIASVPVSAGPNVTVDIKNQTLFGETPEKLAELAKKPGDLKRAVQNGVISKTSAIKAIPDTAKASELLALNPSDSQCESLLGVKLPGKVSCTELLSRHADVSVGDIGDVLNDTKSYFTGVEFAGKSLDDLGDMVSLVKKAAISELKCLCAGGRSGSFNFDFSILDLSARLSALLKSLRDVCECDELPNISFDGIPKDSLPFASGVIMEGASKLGNFVTVDAVIKSEGKSATNHKRTKLVDGLLENVKIPKGLSSKEKDILSVKFVDSLDSIKSGWNKKSRDGVSVSDLTAYSKASPEALDLLRRDPRTKQDAIVAEMTTGKHRPNIATGLNLKYPLMQKMTA